MSVQKSFPELNHARPNQQAPDSFPFCTQVKNLPGHSCLKHQAKHFSRCLSGPTAQEIISFIKGRPHTQDFLHSIFKPLVLKFIIKIKMFMECLARILRGICFDP